MLKLSVCVLCIICVLAGSLAHAAPATIVVGSEPTKLERLAARELQKYLYAGTDTLLPIADHAQGDAIAVGTPASNPLVRRLEPQIAELGDQGFLLRTLKDGNRRVLLVAGNTPHGVLYGVYSLLEEYGFGFYLGGDAIPMRRPYRLLDLNIARKPVFKIRGTLPWYNFFNSPTAWDFEDYVWFFDQLVKAKNNFVGFHVYDFEPFAAYQENGRYAAGEPLASTSVETWGTVPMKTSEFGFGTSRYFGAEYFGAGPSLYRNKRERSIRDSQALLRKALDYAKARGLKVCLGFEVRGRDPTDPAQIELLEKRLKHLVTQYPMLDYVWLWEPEAWALGRDPPSLDSDFGAYYRRYKADFAYLNDPRKITEATRLAVYAREAYRILRETSQHIRLVLSGWGGDNHLRCSDFYPGLDKILPKDIVFAALDNIVVSDMVSTRYTDLSPERERWPIPWLEYDGDQWFPQPNAKTFGKACRDALLKGCQGILGIHWRTRDVEESHALMSQFAWNPKLTYERFYADYAKRCFGEAYAAEMAHILTQLQSLGYRWVGGTGQQECGRFGWGSPTDPAKVRKLEKMLARLRRIHAEMAARPEYGRQAERAAYLISTGEWALRYEQTAGALRPGGEVAELLRRSRELKLAANDSEAEKFASEGLEKLSACRFDLALDACAHRITNKGELGILATVNAKAYAAYRAVQQELRNMTTGEHAEAANRPSSNPQPEIRNPKWALSPINPNTIWFAGASLPIKVVTHGDECRVRVVYRQIGELGSHSVNLRKSAGRYFEGALDCPADASNGIEYAIELSDAAGNVIQRWPGVSLMHQVALIQPIQPSKPIQPPKVEIPSITEVHAEPAEGGSIILQWKAPVGRYEIRRALGNEPFELIRTTSDTWFEDRDVPPGRLCLYSITPVGPGGPGGAVVSGPIETPTSAQFPPPRVTAIAGPEKVRLRWQKAALGTSGFLVYEAPSADGPWKCLNPERPVAPNYWCGHRFVAQAEPEELAYYTVVTLDRWDSERTASDIVLCSALPAGDLGVTLALDFDDEKLSGGSWGEYAALEAVNGVPAAHFENGNHVVFPHRPEFNPDVELTVELWVNLERAGEMPVLLCHGAWGVDGYLLQILHGRVRFYLHGVGMLDAGVVKPGKWYHIAATYDGCDITIFLNGEQVGRRQPSGRLTPSRRKLYIGRYDSHAPEYETDCRITGVRLYSIALSADEIKREYHYLAEKLR